MTALTEFAKFLSVSDRIQEDIVKYYVDWVQRFLKCCKYQPEDISVKTIEQYLDSLDADEGVADWQVKQAVDAVIDGEHRTLIPSKRERNGLLFFVSVGLDADWN
jgi:hypothetical protein